MGRGVVAPSRIEVQLAPGAEVGVGGAAGGGRIDDRLRGAIGRMARADGRKLRSRRRVVSLFEELGEEGGVRRFGALPIGARTPEIPGAGPTFATAGSLPSRTRPTTMIRHAEARFQTPGNEPRGREKASDSTPERIAPDRNREAAAIGRAHPLHANQGDQNHMGCGSPRAIPPENDLV